MLYPEVVLTGSVSRGMADEVSTRVRFSYDASYVALAELTGATLVTLDRRISRAPDLRCTIATP